MVQKNLHKELVYVRRRETRPAENNEYLIAAELITQKSQ